MDHPLWFLDESAHAGDEHLDPRYVAGYDRKAAMDPTDDAATLRGFGLDGTQTLVDFGAGTGTLVLAAAPLFKRLVAVDVSSAMITRLQEKAAQLGLGNIECVRSSLLTYEHRGDPADVAYSRHALHHLPDFWKALALERIAATLRPGGLLLLRDLVFSFEPGEAARFIEPWLANAAEQPDAGWTRPELETHMREEYSTFTWLLEPIIEHAGFEIREASYSESRIYAAYTCTKR
jgi:SAM-dependent methyltransferase